MNPMRRGHSTKESAAATTPANPHFFANRTATCRLPARFSLSDNGRFPALVMKNTGYDFCLIASRIQISGENEDRMTLRPPAN